MIYYPTFYVDNLGTLNNVSIPPPAIQGQRLTLVNKGVSPASTWNDITAYNAGMGVQTAVRSSNGLVWIVPVSSNTGYIFDESLSNQLGYFTVGASGGGQQVYCMLEDGGYMYLGGDFASINGNAIAQVGMTRVSIYAPFNEDPFYDGAGSINGIQYGGTVYDIEAYGGLLYFGGNFNSFSNSSPAWNICSVSVSSSSSIYDWCNGGVNNRVYALLGSGSFLFVGGEFTQTAYGTGSPSSNARLATYTGGVGGSWDYTGGNTWNAPVNTLQYTNTGQYIFVGGDFTNTAQNFNCYIDYNAPNTSPTDTLLYISNPLPRNSTFYNGATYVSTQSNGVYYSTATQVWTNDGTPRSGNNPSYIGQFNGTINVAYTDYLYFLARTSVSQNATFTLTGGKFKFNDTLFSSATISLRDVGWDFVGDLSTSTYTWRQTSYNPWGSYS